MNHALSLMFGRQRLPFSLFFFFCCCGALTTTVIVGVDAQRQVVDAQQQRQGQIQGPGQRQEENRIGGIAKTINSNNNNNIQQ
mmetsp:Transcript_44651/g.50053  ORF Transcript_44651/g.50053 Transcript_44651/m.50053 type:complete len:83 (-) Transcript_44651:7-255(-)